MPRFGPLPWIALSLLLVPIATADPDPRPVRFQANPPSCRTLPGSADFHFSLYGCPSDPSSLTSLVEVLKSRHLASAFDPGPAAAAASGPVLAALATLGWPVVLYPPDGGRMQVQGGTSVLSGNSMTPGSSMPSNWGNGAIISTG